MKKNKKEELKIFIQDEYFWTKGAEVRISSSWLEENRANYSFHFDIEEYRNEHLYLNDTNKNIILYAGWRIPARIFAGTRNGGSGNTFFITYRMGEQINTRKMADLDVGFLQLFAVPRGDKSKVNHIAKYRDNLKTLSGYKFLKKENKAFKSEIFEYFGQNYSFAFCIKKRLVLSNDSYHSGERNFFAYYECEERTLGAEIELNYCNSNEMDAVNVALNRPRNARAWGKKFKSESDSSLRGDYCFEILNLGYGSYKDFLTDNKEMLSVAFAGKVDDPARSRAGLHFHIGNFANDEERNYFAQLINIIINNKTEDQIIKIFGRNFTDYCYKQKMPTGRGSVHLSNYNTVEVRLFNGATSLEDFTNKYKEVCKLVRATDRVLNQLQKKIK